MIYLINLCYSINEHLGVPEIKNFLQINTGQVRIGMVLKNLVTITTYKN